MKKFYLTLLLLCTISILKAQTITIPDPAFKAKLLAASPLNQIALNINNLPFKIDANSDGEIQVSEAQAVYQLYVQNSNIASLSGIENFTNLQRFNFSHNLVTSLNTSGLTNINELLCYYNQLPNLDLTMATNLFVLNCSHNELSTLNLSGLAYLQDLDSSYSTLNSVNLAGCTNLVSANFSYNDMTTIDVSGLTSLAFLMCDHNNLTSINVSGCPALANLLFENNEMTTIDCSGLTDLRLLSCADNNLTSINLSGINSLYTLSCSYNQLTNLNLSGYADLQTLMCDNNSLTSLLLDGCDSLVTVQCQFNQLTTLDLNDAVLLNQLFCQGNQLSSLFIKNGRNESASLTGNPLEYICADEIQIASLSAQWPATAVNAYCTFTPGGPFFVVEGTTRIDFDDDGCQPTDAGVPNMRFDVSDGIIDGAIYGASGAYTIPLLAGSHTITPSVYNPTFFNITPSSVVVDFPTQTSPLQQNFCVTPIGVHYDLEVIIVPLSVAQAGFDATYKIIYMNHGTHPASGTISFQFDDAVMDIVSAVPTLTAQVPNSLTWDYTNLLPFEARSIIVVMNLNSPVDVPALNGGDNLMYEASISLSDVEEAPDDNNVRFVQLVVNAIDPNDKTCLEGNSIPPSEVGKYVHYMIRFENTGTANAVNVVVKDVIDPAKFDISTLVPFSGSHPFITNISAGNKVEFIFENINLPFDNANNDGYVAFKVKTKPTLVVGDSFSNTASIYFDYNFPIVTDPAVTTVAILKTKDFEFSDYFAVYPNPVNDILNIQSKQNAQINSISIYNTLGQLLMVIPNAKNISTVDVSNLTAGNYFIKINSDKGSSATKFIKL